MQSRQEPIPEAIKKTRKRSIIQCPFLPKEGVVRGEYIYGNPKKGIPNISGKSRSGFYQDLKDNKYPFLTPIRLTQRTTVYKVEQVRQLIAFLGGDIEAV